MIRNICKIKYRSAESNTTLFEDIDLSFSGNTLEVSDEDVDSGKLYSYSIALNLKNDALFARRGVILEVSFETEKIIIGSVDFPVRINSALNTDKSSLSIDYKTPTPPLFLPLA